MNRFRRAGSRHNILISGLLFAIWFGSASCGGNRGGVPAVDRGSDKPAKAIAADSEQAKLQLNAFEELTGTDYLIAPVSSPYAREDSSLGSSAPSREQSGYTRNYLFVNLADKSSHLLLPTNDLLILSAENLTEKAQAKQTDMPAKNAPQKENDKTADKTNHFVKWICYRVIKADTDNDKRLSANDLKTIALSDASGLNYTEIITEVQAVLHEIRRGDSLIFIYTADGRNQIAEISLPTKQLIATKDLQEIALR
jgi:hypothetical protein